MGTKNKNGIEMSSLDAESHRAISIAQSASNPSLAVRLLGKKRADWLKRRCGCIDCFGCLGINDEEYRGLVAEDGVKILANHIQHRVNTA